MNAKTTNHNLLIELQRGLPLEPKPFLALAAKTGMDEGDVIEQIKTWFTEGKARRMGGVFDARRLGYKSTLCALLVPHKNIDETASLITPHPGVTHCYLRGKPDQLDNVFCPDANTPNIWFTLAVPVDEFDTSIASLKTTCQPYELLSLPAIRRFKIDVIFDPGMLEKGELFPGAAPANINKHENSELHEFSDKEKALVQLLDKNIPITSEPFNTIAETAGYTIDELLHLLTTWQNKGILRRMALILHHHKVGFKANAMCIWPVEDNKIIEAGRSLASNKEVTHCYQRPTHALFPYNLFAMIHTDSWENTTRLFQRISDKAGLHDGKMLCSLKEYKKTSMQYFKA